MASESKEKGDALEKAVAFIQETILKHDPKLKGSTFTVERNKICKIEGSSYEADVFVTIAPDSIYQSTMIFECKNWRRPVDRKEVTDFSDKVKMIGAARGFLVARDVTKDALAKLGTDNRLIYVPCSDSFADTLNFRLFHVEYDLLPLTINFKQRLVAPRTVPETFDASGKVCLWFGQPRMFEGFLWEQVQKLISDEIHKYGRVAYEGTYWLQCGEEVHFSPQELLVESMDLGMMCLFVRCFAKVRQRKIISKFELSEQGRFVSFEPINTITTGQQIEVNVVQLL